MRDPRDLAYATAFIVAGQAALTAKPHHRSSVTARCDVSGPANAFPLWRSQDHPATPLSTALILHCLPGPPQRRDQNAEGSLGTTCLPEGDHACAQVTTTPPGRGGGPAQPPGLPAHGRRHRRRWRLRALAAPALAQEGSAGSQGHSRHRVPRDQISIQLYTLRDQLAIDLEGTLQALADIGYTRVEHAGFVGRTVTEFKAALDAAGLRATSGHVQIPQPFDPAAWSASLADATTLGSRYIVHPFFGINFATGEVTRTTAPWRAFARDLNRAGRMARDAGLKLGYHNHNWEFFRLTDNPAHGLRRPHRQHRPGPGAPGAGPVLGHQGRPRPGRPHPPEPGRVLQYHVKDMNQAGSFEDPARA